MATLAVICESSKKIFDIIHFGEDLHFLPDGRAFVGFYLALEVPKSSRESEMIKIAIHGKILELKQSAVVRDQILKDPDVTQEAIKDGKFIVYNHTFLDPHHPSNEGFEGYDYQAEGRECSFDGYSGIHFPSSRDIRLRVMEKGEISFINLEYPEKFKLGKRYIFRLGFLLGSPKERKIPRLWIIPPVEKQRIHFYSTRGLPTDDAKYIEKLKAQIADIRLVAPYFKDKEIKTCDFFYTVDRRESIVGLGSSETTKRLPFGREGIEFRDERISYHKYAQDLHQIKPIRKELPRRRGDVEVLQFEKCEPYELTIERAPRSLFFATPPAFLAILALNFLIFGLKNWAPSLILAVFFTILLMEVMRRVSVVYHR